MVILAALIPAASIPIDFSTHAEDPRNQVGIPSVVLYYSATPVQHIA